MRGQQFNEPGLFKILKKKCIQQYLYFYKNM